jgi:predicted nucleotidyltransferase
MRLSREQKQALNTALQGVRGEIYLFGSRVRTAARGGDIDILILTDIDPYELSKQVKARFIMECDERIDVVVMNPNALTQENIAFLQTIEKERIQ